MIGLILNHLCLQWHSGYSDTFAWSRGCHCRWGYLYYPFRWHVSNTRSWIGLNFKIWNFQYLSTSSQECFVFKPGMFWLEFASALHLSCHERLGTWGCLRDISEISWGRRDLMLMWTQTKTPLAWSCEHKLNHKQTKHNPRCLLWFGGGHITCSTDVGLICKHN